MAQLSFAMLQVNQREEEVEEEEEKAPFKQPTPQSSLGS